MIVRTYYSHPRTFSLRPGMVAGRAAIFPGESGRMGFLEFMRSLLVPSVPEPTREGICPSCSKPLQPRQLADMSVQGCRSCKGVWMDCVALQEALKRTDLQLEDRSLDTGSFSHTFSRSRSSRQCPCCEEKMDNYQFADTSGIWIDSCPKGHGTWLDSGEFEMIWKFSQLGGEEKSDLDGARQAYARENLSQDIDV